MKRLLLAILTLLAPLSEAETGPSGMAPPAPTQAWRHRGVLTLLTTQDGSNLPATAMIEPMRLDGRRCDTTKPTAKKDHPTRSFSFYRYDM